MHCPGVGLVGLLWSTSSKYILLSNVCPVSMKEDLCSHASMQGDHSCILAEMQYCTCIILLWWKKDNDNHVDTRLPGVTCHSQAPKPAGTEASRSPEANRHRSHQKPKAPETRNYQESHATPRHRSQRMHPSL